MKLIDQIKNQARKDIKHIVLPESMDARTIKAAVMVVEEGYAEVSLVGSEDEIRKKYPDCDFGGIYFIDPTNHKKRSLYIERLTVLRSDKGVTTAMAETLLLDPLYFGVMMVKMGDADGMVAGAANSTSDTLRPALQIVKTAQASKLVSSVHIMCLDNKEFGHNGILLYGDTALNEDPNAEALAEIAVASAKTFKQLVGEEPKVAMLSYSTFGSASSPLVSKVVEATAMAKTKAPNVLIEGELQLDAALISEIGMKKAPESKVAGNANVLIFPDLNSGNIGYKMTERLAGASALGAITQGLAMPINDMSRGCTAEDIAGVIAITAVQAQDMEA